MIPKIIHYCWFGRNPKSKLMQKCIKSWRKFCPDYEIIEWNEDNFDINRIPFIKKAYEEGKWAFVTDYARLCIIFENGGIYLDTDVELIRPLDRFLNEKAYFAFQGDDYINTGLGFGSEKGNPLLLELMADYEGRNFIPENGSYTSLACPVLNTAVFERHGLIKNGKLQETEGNIFYPRDYFDPKDLFTYELNITENTHSIHHYDASWKHGNSRLKQTVIRLFVRLFGRDVFMKIKNKLNH